MAKGGECGALILYLFSFVYVLFLLTLGVLAVRVCETTSTTFIGCTLAWLALTCLKMVLYYKQTDIVRLYFVTL